jgi:hypothetical protein
VSLRGGGERVAMAHLDAEHAVAEGGEDPAGDLGEGGARRGVMEEDGTAQGRRPGTEPLGADRLQRARGLANAIAGEESRSGA